MATRILLAALTLFHAYNLKGQDRFRNFHGIMQERNHYFEAEGADIFVRFSERSLDEKGISKIIKEYKMKDAQRKDTVILNKSIVLVKKEMQNGFELTRVCYLLRKDDYLTTVIGFSSFTRDVSLEHFFIEAWLNQTVPDYVYTTMAVSTVDFVGRDIKLVGACPWMSPHNLQCPDYGQMSWSVFESEQAATRNRDQQIEIMKKKSLTDIKEDISVPVTFEGVPVQARRITVKIQVPKLIMGGSNVLIVYYVTANVRNKYVTCVLSHYTDDVEGKTFAPLLQEVMSLDK